MKTKRTAYHAAPPSKIDQVLMDAYLTQTERNQLFQEFLEDDKYKVKVKPRYKHPKKREEEI